ncbi:DUF397 domain-containing protein [Streptomyces sp. NPDC006365]|uniref:DUF397 domain-containing protein n=1 Tax=Streptomyces sp. NPDC006365 TaxID=3364744 RepID=UPI00369A2A5B
MPQLTWQKSSFSGGAEGNCINVAVAPDGTIHLRESDDPRNVLTTAAQGFAALLDNLRRSAT